jgi:archaellum biogenesis ATPase FlaH
MNRAQLEHVIRASTTICHDDEVIIIGSQAILLFKHRIVAVEEILRAIAEMPIETRTIIEHNIQQCSDRTTH